MLKTSDPESSGEDVEGQIARCLAAAEDAVALRQELSGLSELSGKRAEFAYCLFSLDLARLGEAEARAQFARHAGVLLEAHRDPSVAAELLGGNEALERRWQRFVPLLAEFDRALGGEPALTADRTLVEPHPARASTSKDSDAVDGPTQDGGPEEAIDGAADAAYAERMDLAGLNESLVAFGGLPPSDRVEFALCLFNLERARLGEESAKTDFAIRTGLLLLAYRDPALADTLIGHSAGLRALWTDLVPYLEEFFEPADDEEALDEEALEVAEFEDPEVRAEAVADALDVIVDRQTPQPPPASGAPKRPPPPPSPTPVPSKLPLAGGRKGSISYRRLTVPPPPAPEPSLLPSPETAAFWGYAEKALALLPDEHGQLSGKQTFALEDRDARTHLKAFAREVVTRFPHSPEARSMGALVELFLAAHLKEKTLFGMPNDKRIRAAQDALSLLTADPVAAGHAAVVFENDGPQTIARFGDALVLVQRFLAHCLREKVDPLSPEAVTGFSG
jgi:hypothetical protein